MAEESSFQGHTDDHILQIANQLRVAYALKRTLRYSTNRDFSVHSESVAEHVFALFFLTQYFLPLEDPERNLSVEKIYRIILFHDIGEITHGDVPYHIKTEGHEKQEREAAIEIFQSLPAVIRSKARNAWKEYEEHRSPEARFVHALDKIEPLFELMDPVNEQSMKRLKFTYQDHIVKKMRATENFPVMKKFVEVMSADMLRRDVFWTKE